jgi:hypothetical protein
MAGAVVGHQAIALDQHVVSDERGAGQRLQLRELRIQALHRGVELVDSADRLDLRHLAGDLRVVHRIQWILVLQLRDQQLEKTILGVGRCGDTGRSGRGVDGTVGVDGGGGHVACRSVDHWPSCSVFSSRFLAVFITSMLFW